MKLTASSAEVANSIRPIMAYRADSGCAPLPFTNPDSCNTTPISMIASATVLLRVSTMTPAKIPSRRCWVTISSMSGIKL
ncbi:hypothetical protein D3C81_2137460 [compost metagenome]